MGHDALVGLPDSVDHEIDKRARFGLGPIQKVEKLIDERVVVGKRIPLKGECAIFEPIVRRNRASTPFKTSAPRRCGYREAYSSAIAPPNETPNTAGNSSPR